MLKIWGRGNSVNVKKVLWAVEELGVKHERINAGMEHGVVKTPEYRKMNPNSLVPTIDDDGFVLWESHAILKYLAGKKPERGLAPSDPKQAALVDQWLFWWSAGVETALNLLLVERMIKPFMGKPGKDAMFSPNPGQGD